MRSLKNILFILAGAWIGLIILDKIHTTADTLGSRKRAVPLRAGFGLLHLVRSLVMGLLAIMNIFLAISYIGARDRAR